jgi:hypothetical protein
LTQEGKINNFFRIPTFKEINSLEFNFEAFKQTNSLDYGDQSAYLIRDDSIDLIREKLPKIIFKVN